MHQLSLLFLFAILTVTGCRKGDTPNKGDISIKAINIQKKAINWLLTKQAEDGGWHSETHGILRGGAAYTPYILDALQESNAIDSQDTCSSNGYAFLLQQLDSTGAIGQKGAYVVEYPVYATSYLLKTWANSPLIFDTLFQLHFEKYLLSQQFTEQRGITPDHPAYGAWGFGEQHLPIGEVGHIDLSHTRRVLEAFQHANLSPTPPCWPKAGIFLERLQNKDGGFCSSTYTLGSNKADDQTHKCVSYATATADGLLALLSFPEKNSRKIELAARWLLVNENWEQVSGITPGRPGNWEKVLFFYHIAVRAQAYSRMNDLNLLPADNDWQQQVVTLLAEKQLSDGSFTNPWGGPNKEDDPLLATALAIRALNAVIEAGL
nr:prenyltransferase/squalene oxidase repeat-containing protein [Lewinella cohaerens]